MNAKILSLLKGLAGDEFYNSQAAGGKLRKGLQDQAAAGFEQIDAQNNPAGDDNPFADMGGKASKAGDGLIGTGNPYAAAAGAVLKFAGALAESFEKIRGWAKELNDANLAFADFSAAMNNVAADQEMRDFERKMGQGDNRAGQAEELSKALGDLNDAMAPFEDAWANFKGEIATVLLEACTAIVKWLPEIGKKDPNDLGAKGVVAGEEAYQKEMERRAIARRPKRLGGGGGGF